MARDRISSNRLSFSTASRADARVDDLFPGDFVGGRAGSSPDSGNKPGARLEGTASEDGSAGSSISFVLKPGEADGPGESPAVATPEAVIRMRAMRACDFIGRTVGSAAPCRIYLQTARRRSARGTAFLIWKNMDSAPQAD
jgi:hypothetical protein